MFDTSRKTLCEHISAELPYLTQEQIGFWSCDWWPGPVKNLETNNWKSALGL